MYYGQLVEEVKSNVEIERAMRVVQILLKDRVRFIQIVQGLLSTRIIEGEDKEKLWRLEAVLKGSPSREAVTSLGAIGRQNARLLALLMAYAVYHVYDN